MAAPHMNLEFKFEIWRQIQKRFEKEERKISSSGSAI